MKAAEMIEDMCTTDPPDHGKPHPDLFSDFEDHTVHMALFELWEKGIIDADWNEEHEESEFWLTAFGTELEERGLTKLYVTAVEQDVEIETNAVRVLNDTL